MQGLKDVKVHDIKILPEFFDAVADGKKTAEFRKNDRGYQAWDTLILHEYDPVAEKLTGSYIKARIKHVTYLDNFGAPGYVLLSLYVVGSYKLYDEDNR